MWVFPNVIGNLSKNFAKLYMLVLLSLPANIGCLQPRWVAAGCACGWSLRGESCSFPASSGRSTFFLSYWLKLSMYKVQQWASRQKKAEIIRKRTCYSSPGQENWNTTTIRQTPYNQKTLCWKKHEKTRFPQPSFYYWQAREFIFTAARLYIFCPGLWSISVGVEDSFAESFHTPFFEWRTHDVSVVQNVGWIYIRCIYIYEFIESELVGFGGSKVYPRILGGLESQEFFQRSLVRQLEWKELPIPDSEFLLPRLCHFWHVLSEHLWISDLGERYTYTCRWGRHQGFFERQSTHLKELEVPEII